ncbi:uncharacterized protein FAM120A2 [Aotus nancymaae]|uniref:uncharacterized protein FAM120A2 n=1 Tax=Aotus nancymaae TaxID=37293 RepID=UPI0030FF3C17
MIFWKRQNYADNEKMSGCRIGEPEEAMPIHVPSNRQQARNPTVDPGRVEQEGAGPRAPGGAEAEGGGGVREGAGLRTPGGAEAAAGGGGARVRGRDQESSQRPNPGRLPEATRQKPGDGPSEKGRESTARGRQSLERVDRAADREADARRSRHLGTAGGAVSVAMTAHRRRGRGLLPSIFQPPSPENQFWDVTEQVGIIPRPVSLCRCSHHTTWRWSDTLQCGGAIFSYVPAVSIKNMFSFFAIIMTFQPKCPAMIDWIKKMGFIYSSYKKQPDPVRLECLGWCRRTFLLRCSTFRRPLCKQSP